MCDLKNPTWEKYGKHFGYPECCISALIFRRDGKISPTSQFDGTGFRPCIKCNEIVEEIGTIKFVDQYITPNRKCPIPFWKNSTTSCQT